MSLGCLSLLGKFGETVENVQAVDKIACDEMTEFYSRTHVIRGFPWRFIKIGDKGDLPHFKVTNLVFRVLTTQAQLNQTKNTQSNSSCNECIGENKLLKIEEVTSALQTLDTEYYRAKERPNLVNGKVFLQFEY
jgi:hypothetical protein